jgi:hypothetical protein
VLGRILSDIHIAPSDTTQQGPVDTVHHLRVQQGELRPDIDPEAGGLAITSFIMGLTLQLWVNPEACDANVSKELARWLSCS